MQKNGDLWINIKDLYNVLGASNASERSKITTWTETFESKYFAEYFSLWSFSDVDTTDVGGDGLPALMVAGYPPDSSIQLVFFFVSSVSVVWS